MGLSRWAPVLAVLLFAACGSPATYHLEGQIVAVDPDAGTLTISHGDIDGLMPGMTMPFKVADPGLMANKAPGDLVKASLVIQDEQPLLTTVEVVGHDALRTPAPKPAVDLLQPGDEVPDVALVDQDGTPRRLSGWRGQAVAVTFVYTRCPLPNFCPAMDRRFAGVQRAMEADPALAARAHLVSITVDPGFDTPQVLKAHANGLGADPSHWTLATGEVDDLDRFGARFGVAVMRDDPREVVHNLRTAVIDASGRLVTVFRDSAWTAEDMAGELRRAGAVR
jgi:protein SCO1/2